MISSLSPEKCTKRLILPGTRRWRFKTAADTEKYYRSVSWKGPEEILDLWKTDLFKEREIFMDAVEVWPTSNIKLPRLHSARSGQLTVSGLWMLAMNPDGSSLILPTEEMRSTAGFHKSGTNQFQGLQDYSSLNRKQSDSAKPFCSRRNTGWTARTWKTDTHTHLHRKTHLHVRTCILTPPPTTTTTSHHKSLVHLI